MKQAIETLKLELERLILLRESIVNSGQAIRERAKLAELNEKIYGHERGIVVLFRSEIESQKLLKRARIMQS